MKQLNNETGYNKWMQENYFPEVGDLLEPEVIENELTELIPDNFPCIVRIVSGPQPQYTRILEFLTYPQVYEWAILIGLTEKRQKS